MDRAAAPSFGSVTVGSIFVLSAAVSGYHVLLHDAPLLAELLGQGSLLVLTLLFGAVAYHALKTTETPRERNILGFRAAAGYMLAGVASGGYALHQFLTPEAAVPMDVILFQSIFVALVGGMAGVFVALEEIRRERTVTNLEETAKELETTQARTRTEKQRFESLFRNTPSAIADIRYVDSKPVIERTNEAFEDRFDDPNAEIEGRNLFDVTPLREKPQESEVAAHVARNEGFEASVTVNRADGYGHYRLRVIPYEVGTGEGHAFVLYTDVTELRETQAELEQNIEKLEESNDRLEQFAYAASHDLQEPLRMVSSYLQMIEDRYGDSLDEDGREFIDFAVDGADRMRKMIEGLLEYSRVESRAGEFEPVDLEEVIEAAHTDLQMKIDEHDAAISVDWLPSVEGDSDQIRQVFQNLLDNAIEYSGEKRPRIHVSAEEGADDEWVISVSDNGVGIDPEDQDRVFQVFERLHSHDEHAGTGIGLALCQRIVERHGGEIWAESEPSEGTTFCFTLPAADEDDTSESKSPPEIERPAR